MIIKTSWDDGRIVDFKLLRLLYKYKLPATFFIPTTCEMHKKDIQYIDALGFRVGGHTTTHPENLHYLPFAEQLTDIVNNKRWLEKIIGKRIKEFCYPGGRFDDQTIKAVKAAWFRSARTTLVGNTDIPKNKYRIETTVHVLPTRKEYKNFKSWLDYAKIKLLEASKKENGYFHVFGHSLEIEKFKLWEDLEKLFIEIKKYN